MLCIGRGLMQNPKLLLMDEIFEGLAPIVITEIMEVVHRLKKSGVSLCIAEQSAKFAREIGAGATLSKKGRLSIVGRWRRFPRMSY